MRFGCFHPPSSKGRMGLHLAAADKKAFPNWVAQHLFAVRSQYKNGRESSGQKVFGERQRTTRGSRGTMMAKWPKASSQVCRQRRIGLRVLIIVSACVPLHDRRRSGKSLPLIARWSAQDKTSSGPSEKGRHRLTGASLK